MEFLSEDIINKFKILKYPRNVYNNYMIQYLNEPYHKFDKGCNKFGVYGSNCNMTCPTNCKNGTYKMGTVLHVHPDGLEYRVKQVRPLSFLSKKKNLIFNRQSGSLTVF